MSSHDAPPTSAPDGPRERVPTGRPVRPQRGRSGARGWLRRGISTALGLGLIAGVIVVLNPREVARALGHFRLALLPPIIALSLAYYVLQGVRWHLLLRDAGARLRLRDTVLLNAAGQAITAVVPLGDLTRAVFVSEATGTEFGRVAATVTVQELMYTLTLVVFALPTLLVMRLGIAAVVLTSMGLAAILVILTVSRVFCAVHGVIARVPLLRQVLPAIEELQHETAELLHRPDTIAWGVLDALRAATAVTSLWLIVLALPPGSITWWKAAFVLALSVIGGAVSLLPGGVGANEAGVAGLLTVFGVAGGAAGAAAVVQRAMVTGTSLLVGVAGYAIARRRFRLGGLFQITTRIARPEPVRLAPAPPG